MSPPIDVQTVNPVAPVPTVGVVSDQAVAKNLDPSVNKEPVQVSEGKSARPVEHMKPDTPMVHLGYTVDHESNSLKIKVTNQDSGEVVREFELKGLGSAHHEPLATKGVVIDDKT
jgi:hypothetical protein